MIEKKSHWLLCIILSFIMVIEVMPVNAYAEETISSDTTWYVGNETSTEYFIDSANKLAGLATLVNGGNNFAGKTINLGADIILNNNCENYMSWASAAPANTWTPIGNSSCSFAGTFNGNNHRVLGVYINSNLDYQGLFGVSSGIIKNVGVINSYIKGNNFVGGIVGQNNYGTINGSFNSAIISGTSNVGGIVGNAFGGAIQKSYNTGAVTGIGSNTGGIIGNADLGTIILYSYNTGMISAYNDASGGIVGKSKSSNIYYCYNTGTIYAFSCSGGGIVGYSESFDQVCICYSVGSVSGIYGGGIVGYDGGSTLYNNNYYTSAEKACGNKDNLSGINLFLPILNTSTLKYGEEEEITEFTGVDILRQYFGSDFSISCTYQSSNTDILSVSGNTIKAVGTPTNSSNSSVYLIGTSIIVKQNSLTSSGFTGGWNGAIYTQNYINIYLSIKVLKADNSLDIACDSFTYDGTTKPSPRIISNNTGESIDFYYYNKESGVSIPEPPTEVGNYIVKAVTKESEHYNRAETSVDFSIHKIESLIVKLPSASEITVRQSLANSILSGGSMEYGTFDGKIQPLSRNIRIVMLQSIE